MDPILQRFLQRVRVTARRRHLAIYEDVVLDVHDHLRSRRRSASRLAGAELRRFLGSWYMRHHGAVTSRQARQFCAATGVLVRWLLTDVSARRRAALLRSCRREVRATARAARASEMLEFLSPAIAEPASEILEDYFEVVACGRSHLALRPLSGSASFAAPPLGPVAVPARLAATLDPGALVNLQLGRAQTRWAILDYGFCYPASARPALREALALEVR